MEEEAATYLLLREAQWDTHRSKLLAQAQIKKKVN